MADIAELIVALKLRDGVSGGLGRLNGQLRGMQGGLSNVGKGIGQVGRGLDTIVTRGALAAAAGLGAVITTAASFEQAFTGVEKTVDGTDAQLAELEETLRGMARTMPVAFEELAAIGEAGGALGIARESLDEFVDVVARLAVSTDLSADSAATALGQLGNVLHLSGAEFEDFADSLVALGNAGASTESQIVEIAARFGAAGNAAGLSKEEILALSSSVASMGIEVEAGGSSLSRLFNQTTTNIGVGSKKAKTFAKALGLTFDDFKNAWDKDALGTFQDLLAHLNELDKFEAAALLKSIGITGVRDINAIGLMAQNVGFVSDQLEIAENAQGALGKESGKFFATTQGQWKILQNNVRDAAAVIGAELLPIVNEVIKDFVGFLSEPGAQKGLKEFAQNLAGGIRDLVSEIRGADFGPLLDTMKGAASIAKGAFDAFRSLPAPIQQLALAAIVANKVTGGAVGGIAAGLGNIIKGVIQIGFDRGSSPGNPLYVRDVLGGKGGLGPAGPTKGAANLLGGIFGLTIVAGIELAIAEWAAQNITRPLNPTSFDFNDIAGASGQFGSQIQVERFIAALSSEVGIPIDEAKADIVAAVNTEGLTFAQAVSALRAELIPLGQFNPANKGGTRAPLGTGTSSAAAPWSAEQKAAYAAMNGKLDELPDTAMFNSGVSSITSALNPLPSILTTQQTASSSASAWGQRHQTAFAAMNAKNSSLVSLAQSSTGYNARTATASEITSRKKFDPTVNVHTNVNTTITVSAADVAQRVASYAHSTRGFGPVVE